MPQIKYLLFDCDNTLVLSEPLAFESCTELGNLIMREHLPSTPPPFQYTEAELQEEFVGLNFAALVRALAGKHGFEVSEEEIKAIVARELQMTTEKISQRGVPCEGVMDVLAKLSSEGKYGLAVVSSSAMPRVQASLKKTGQDGYFGPRVYSAASMSPPTSKPDPAVYLDACKQLGVEPEECIAIEDSKSGATAAMRAGINVLGYVGPYYDEGGIQKVKKMEEILTRDCKAKAVMHHWKDFESCLKTIESS